MMRLWIAGRADVPLVFDDHKLAESIIDSPVRIYKVEIKYQMFYPWYDITSKYQEQIDKAFEYWRKESMKIKSIPKYNPGDVVDLSYKNGGLPNRILVTCVFWRPGDKQWMYRVLMENTGKDSILDETFITARASKKTSPVYGNPDIVNRIASGWRFCGNYDTDTAIANGKLIAENTAIKNVKLWPALNYNNQLIKGQKGIWIVWNSTINNDGSCCMGDATQDDIISIK